MLTEVHEATGKSSIRDYHPKYALRQVAINPSHVICIREDMATAKLLKENLLPQGLDPRSRFSRVTINKGHTGADMIVIGTPEQIQEKLYISRKQLLKG